MKIGFSFPQFMIYMQGRMQYKKSSEKQEFSQEIKYIYSFARISKTI